MTEPNLDKQIQLILRDFDNTASIYAIEVKARNETAKAQIQELIANQVREAYRKGYNDNARDCYCDSPGATEGVLPHKHLMDDGESHDIRPDIKELGEDK